MKKQLVKYAPFIFAVLMVASIIFWYISKPDGQEKMTSDHFQPEQEKLVGILGKIKVFGFAGIPQTKDDSLAAALDLYGAGKYHEAQTSLGHYLVAYPNDHAARFYLGAAHLYLHEYDIAFNILSPLSELKNFDMQDDARWYAALAASNVDKVRATGLFGRISNDTTSKYQQAAEMVMASLGKRPGEFRFLIESGENRLATGVLLIAAQATWWQSQWARMIIAFLFPAGGASLLFWRNKVLRVEKATALNEKELSDQLLHNILPAETAEELKKYGHTAARRFEDVTVLFCDFKDFTKISEQLSPEELVNCIGECFEAFDRIIESHGLEKIKTVGDCYICVGGLTVDVEGKKPKDKQEQAMQMVLAGQAMHTFLKGFNERKAAVGQPLFKARIGIHTGPVVAGIVGIKKYAYDIWGDTVNIAARMEQASEAGHINISAATYQLVKSHFNCQHRGSMVAKGKGEVDMYFVFDQEIQKS